MKHNPGQKTASELTGNDKPVRQALLTAMEKQPLSPGSRLLAEALAKVFAISRTGIRNVLQRLAAVQMIMLTPRRGAHVASPDAQEARDICRHRVLSAAVTSCPIFPYCVPIKECRKNEFPLYTGHQPQHHAGDD
ncbi:hypothetical protein COO59_06595 [Mixta theicola]|uniref:HTH gntR-type domain-containing protein n=1 Tax=Mixta theicola TaxID=1458355 RepID=A0A2K1QCM9_9GAMM|nr:hypothetical protein COO59_06595 [Mixta theicola]GLR10355.1 hypothetical protein GCM10007905_30750 [Mixta theicola]